MFCKPEVKLILEGLQAERENGRDQTGLSGDIENNRGIQEGALCGSFLHNANRTSTREHMLIVYRYVLLLLSFALQSLSSLFWVSNKTLSLSPFKSFMT